MQPTHLFGDNMGMIQSASIPESDLKKKHVTMSFHLCREATAAGINLLFKVDAKDNCVDMCAKALASTMHIGLVNDVFWQLSSKLPPTEPRKNKPPVSSVLLPMSSSPPAS